MTSTHTDFRLLKEEKHANQMYRSELIASGFHNPEADLQATPYPDHAAGSIDQTALIEATINTFNQRFSELAQDETKFHQVFQAAFGRSYHAGIAEHIRTQTLIGDLSFLPNVRLASSADLRGHLGAYQADKQIIYLDESADAQSLAPVFMEEVGHHFDTLMSTTDATGDEGALFQMLLAGESVSSDAFRVEARQNDHGLLTISGQTASVEFTDLQFYLNMATDFQIQQQVNQLTNAQSAFQSTYQSNQDAIQSALNASLNQTLHGNNSYSSSRTTTQVTSSTERHTSTHATSSQQVIRLRQPPQLGARRMRVVSMGCLTQMATFMWTGIPPIGSYPMGTTG